MKKKTLRNTQLLSPSVVDRLITVSNSEIDLMQSRTAVISEVKESVRRDLEALLNTRQRCGMSLDDYDDLENTVYAYGIPDFTGASFATEQERELLRRSIERIVQVFEPRFTNVRVSELSDSNNETRTVRFRIQADLRVEPAVKPVMFDSIIDPVTRKLDIEENAGG